MTGSALAGAVRRAVDDGRDELLDALREAVEIESGTEDLEGVSAVGDLLAGRLGEAGMSVHRVPGRDVAPHVVAEPPAGGARVLVMGHLDTVYPRGTGWGFRIDGDRAFGPGVADMKAGDLMAADAVGALRAATGSLPPVRIVLTSDEEPGSPESRAHIPRWAEGIEAAIVLEPSEPGGELVNRRKGVGIFRLRVAGRAAHAGQQPEMGRNAIAELVHQLAAIQRLASPDDGTTVNVGVVSGGTAPYVVPAEATAAIDVRAVTVAEQRRVEEAIAVTAASPSIRGTTVTVEGGFHRPPMEALAGSDRIAGAFVAAAAALGLAEPSFALSGAASDGNNVAAEGVPVIDGAGVVGGALHSPDEWLDVPSLFDRTAMLATAIGLLTAEESR